MNHPAPLVSVIIPTYRHAEYIGETLASVFAQTFSDYEVVVVNDGSPDDTGERLRPLAESGRIRYFEQANAGQSVARNRGFAESRGEIIAYLDDDDLWPPDKLAWQVAAMREHPEWVMLSGISGCVEADGSLRDLPAMDGELTLQSAEVMFEDNGIGSPGQVVIRREALVAVGGFDPHLWGTDDTDLWIRLAAHGTAAQIKRTALYYRLHAGNASHAVDRMFWNAVKATHKNLRLLPLERRKPTWRNALTCIYGYSGTRVVKAARQDGFHSLWAALRVLAYILPTALRDATLARLISIDVLPEWLQTLRGRLKRVRLRGE